MEKLALIGGWLARGGLKVLGGAGKKVGKWAMHPPTLAGKAWRVATPTVLLPGAGLAASSSMSEKVRTSTAGMRQAQQLGREGMSNPLTMRINPYVKVKQ